MLIFLKFAGTVTNARHLVYTMKAGLKYAITGHPINLSQHIGAMIDDVTVIEEANQILERVAIKQKSKNR